jgi:hypothetical protein
MAFLAVGASRKVAGSKPGVDRLCGCLPGFYLGASHFKSSGPETAKVAGTYSEV